jgi:cyanophycin synthetase
LSIVVLKDVVADFFSRVERGTWMGHVIDIALEIQSLAGMETGLVELEKLKHLELIM